MKAITVSQKGRFENRFGIFFHKTWIGKPFGSKVFATQGGRGWVHLLRPTPELWTQVLRHRTQILYIADISMVIMQLELKPGCVVLESGTGSGSLTHSLIRAVAPAGHVHTFEFHPGRAEEAAVEFKEHGLASLVTVTQRNIEELGFPETLHGKADGVFLDLPGPWKVVPSVAACLKPNGRFCGFSPCIEQVQRTSEALSANGFTDIITYECLLREYEVQRESMFTSIQLAPPPPKRHRPNPAPAAAAPILAEAAPQGAAKGAEEPQGAAGAAPEAAMAEGADAAAEPGSGPAADAGKQEGAAEAAATDAGGASEAAARADATEAQGGGGGKEEGAAGQEDGAPAAAGPACERAGAPAPAARAGHQSVRFVSCRPSLEARGHTGYLLFARKFVCG